MPMLAITAVVAEIRDGIIHVGFLFADHTRNSQAMKDGEQWSALAKNLESLEWDALGMALRNLGLWVTV